MLEHRTVDLVILDQELGPEDGLSFLADLKAKYPDIPIVMMTGKDFQEESFQRALKHGANGYLSKRLTLDHVLMEVSRLVHYRKVMDLPSLVAHTPPKLPASLM